MKTNVRKYLAEGLLIVFSVLFALFINKFFDDYKTHQKKTIALESIKKELYRNQAILKLWKERHISIRKRIASISEGKSDSLKTKLKQNSFLDLGVLTNNKSIVDAFLIDTAWESAKATGIIAEFDFETTQSLTHVYNMQDILTNKTLRMISDYYFSSASHDLQKLDQILLQFQLRFWELTGQEESLTTLYVDAIKQMKQ